MSSHLQTQQPIGTLKTISQCTGVDFSLLNNESPVLKSNVQLNNESPVLKSNVQLNNESPVLKSNVQLKEKNKNRILSQQAENKTSCLLI